METQEVTSVHFFHLLLLQTGAADADKIRGKGTGQ